MVRMVVSDVDGTLIYKGSHLNTARFPVMLEKLDSLKIPFAVATGRHYRELKKLFGNHATDILCCCCDGAYTVLKGEVFCSLPLPKSCVRYFFENFAGKKEYCVEFHSVNTTYILGGTPMFHSKENSRLSVIEKIYSYDDINEDIFFISLYGKNAKDFPSPEGARVSYSSCGITEYVNRHASKYEAVKKLADHYGLSAKDILFFGDGENDRELIENCGTSYTTYCADKKVFGITQNHTRDCIGTIIRLCGEWQKKKQRQIIIQ